MGLFSRKRIYIEKEDFPHVIKKLTVAFETLREEYMFGSISQLKRGGVDVSEISREIRPGSELEHILKGFQLTSMIGIAWDYIKNLDDRRDFDDTLSNHINAGEGTLAADYREKYIDCQGDMEPLSRSLALDVHRAIGSPSPEIDYLSQFQGGAFPLVGLCQAATCSSCGDSKMEQKIKQSMRLA